MNIPYAVITFFWYFVRPDTYTILSTYHSQPTDIIKTYELTARCSKRGDLAFCLVLLWKKKKNKIGAIN